jgi:hypothetical protein
VLSGLKLPLSRAGRHQSSRSYERIEVVSAEIESLSENNAACQRVLSLMRGSQVHWGTPWRGGEPTTSRTYPARCQS